mmetsp:Transcript_60178/g.141690  ORF Transcript_60178/g.141690 Transcript_60178/m.141690 type:complete len:224 (-) Transcript_60178:16-687(-)
MSRPLHRTIPTAICDESGNVQQLPARLQRRARARRGRARTVALAAARRTLHGARSPHAPGRSQRRASRRQAYLPQSRPFVWSHLRGCHMRTREPEVLDLWRCGEHCEQDGVELDAVHRQQPVHPFLGCDTRDPPRRLLPRVGNIGRPARGAEGGWDRDQGEGEDADVLFDAAPRARQRAVGRGSGQRTCDPGPQNSCRPGCPGGDTWRSAVWSTVNVRGNHAN